MVRVLFILLFLLLFSGCQHLREAEEAEAGTRLYLPTYTFLAKASARFAEKQTTVPSDVYVFPALRMNAKGQPTDQLSYRTLADGTLGWYTDAPLGSELKVIVEQKLKTLGFTPISFGELGSKDADHSALVFNLYYTEAAPSQDNPTADPSQSWTTFCRITASTFSKDLSPGTKRDLMNQELISLFNDRNLGTDVIKRSTTYLLDYIGATRQWSKSINMLL